MPHVTIPISTTAPDIAAYTRLEPVALATTTSTTSTATTPTVSANVNDALWFLTQQWRVGEFIGTDGGTLVKAKIETQSSYINRFKGTNSTYAEPFETNIPLEAKIERLPLIFDLGMQLEVGLQWYKILVQNSQQMLYSLFVTAFPISNSLTDPELASNKNSVQARLLTAGRLMNGQLFTQFLAIPKNASQVAGVTSAPGYIAANLTNAQNQFTAWLSKTYYQPADNSQDSWNYSKLEYNFSASLPLSSAAGASQIVFNGDKYATGDLDWYSVDVDPNAADKLNENPSSPISNATIDGHSVIASPVVISYVPSPIEWKGMPTGRWWQFEDANMDLSKMLTQKQDIAKLVLMEYGLIYSNDWLMIPHQVDNGTMTQINGLVVTDVFGQQFEINRAGSAAEDSWQKWDMYAVNKQGGDDNLGKLLILPNLLDRTESDPIERVLFLRDDMAEMIWGVEDMVPNDLFGGVSGTDAYTNLITYLTGTATPPALPPGYTPTGATLRFKLNNSIPENWIPFVSVANNGYLNRTTMVQRAAMLRYINDEYTNQIITPRTHILSEKTPFYIYEQEVSDSGFIVSTSFKRTRWYDGSVYVWLGRKKQTGRGVADSGYKFDTLVSKQPNT